MSKIEWTDETWNPTTGCTWASPGCDHCYAAGMTRRLQEMGQEKYAGLTTRKHFNGTVKTHPDALDKPLAWKKPRRVFVDSMSDLFHAAVPFDFIDRVFAVMALAETHTFQVLTKRPERMAEYLGYLDSDCRERLYDEAYELRKPILGQLEAADRRRGFTNGPESPQFDHAVARLKQHFADIDWPLPNVWLGTSVEDQQRADERIPHLLRCPAAVRFLSCEPLLGRVRIDVSGGAEATHNGMPAEVCGMCGMAFAADVDHRRNCEPLIDWIIVGGESGPGARPMHPDWARSIRDQCAAAGVPFLFKQWGAWHPARDWYGGDEKWAHGLTDGYVGDEPVLRVGKKAAGRLLDGREHNEFPEAKEPAGA